MDIEFCCSCGIEFHITMDLYRRRLKDKQSFSCPNGHNQHFEGESENIKLIRENDILKRKISEKNAQISHEQEEKNSINRRLSAVKGVVTKLKNHTK